MYSTRLQSISDMSGLVQLNTKEKKGQKRLVNRGIYSVRFKKNVQNRGHLQSRDFDTSPFGPLP